MKSPYFYLGPLVIALLVGGCGKPEWKEFSSPEGKFKVLFPGAPKSETRPAGPLTLKAHAVELRDGVYVVSYADLPPGNPFDYSASIRGMAAPWGGKVLSETDVTVEGTRGKGFEMEVTNPRKGYATGRIVVISGRLYQIFALGNNMRASEPDVQKFLDSFKLIK
jgi:hypothetical protein